MPETVPYPMCYHVRMDLQGDAISIKLDICIVRSPDGESVDEGECERGGVGESSLMW
jgi:hypothetical protein